VFTQFPNRTVGRVFPGYRRSLRSVTSANGFKVVRCPNWLIGRARRPWNRVLENLTFGLSSALNLLREERPDLLILETWPLMAAQIGIWVGRWWNVPVLYYVQDSYPEALEHTGFLACGGILARMLRRWDRSICRASFKVIVISEGMKRLLQQTRNLSEEDVAVMQNWIDPARFAPNAGENLWRVDVGIPSTAFVAMFAGTLGHVSGAGILVDAARLLRHRPEVLVVCVGEGLLRESMEAEAAQSGLTNIRFLPFQPAERVAEMQLLADVLLLTTQAGYPDASVPSKLITYLAAGRPVVCAAAPSSTVAQHVLAARAGLVAEADDAAAIAEAILKVRGDPVGAAAMGENARRYFLEHFTFDRAYCQFEELLSGLTVART
jgi:colanic acid biosynthesis glycosyl transferase WcaI